MYEGGKASVSDGESGQGWLAVAGSGPDGDGLRCQEGRWPV